MDNFKFVDTEFDDFCAVMTEKDIEMEEIESMEREDIDIEEGVVENNSDYDEKEEEEYGTFHQPIPYHSEKHRFNYYRRNNAYHRVANTDNANIEIEQARDDDCCSWIKKMCVYMCLDIYNWINHEPVIVV